MSKNVEECRAVGKGTHQLLLEESQLEHACLNIEAGGGAAHMGKRDDSAMYGVYVLSCPRPQHLQINQENF